MRQNRKPVSPIRIAIQSVILCALLLATLALRASGLVLAQAGSLAQAFWIGYNAGRWPLPLDQKPVVRSLDERGMSGTLWVGLADAATGALLEMPVTPIPGTLVADTPTAKSHWELAFPGESIYAAMLRRMPKDWIPDTLVQNLAPFAVSAQAVQNAGYYPWHAYPAHASGYAQVSVTQDRQNGPADPKTGTCPFDRSHCIGGPDEWAWDFGDGHSGWPVHASRAGKIAWIDTSHPNGSPTPNVIVIDLGNNFAAIYMHLAQDVPARFSVNQRVATGDLIGFADNTGHSTAPHLHFAIQPWSNTWNGDSTKWYQHSSQSLFSNEVPYGNPGNPTYPNVYTSHVANSGGAKLDPTFAKDGWVDSHVVFSDAVQDLAVQPSDGKIIAVIKGNMGVTMGDFNVVRYSAGGALDTAFGTGGYVVTDFGGVDDPYSVVLQSDKKIVVAGQSCYPQIGGCDLVMARYNPDGTLDTSFGSAGMVRTDYHGFENGSRGGLAIQPKDGKIVVAGYIWSRSDSNMAVYRYTARGILDKTFDVDGIAAVIAFGPGRYDDASDVALQADGKIVVAGTTCGIAPDCNFAVARLSPNGSLDTTFSSDGKQVVDLGGYDSAYGVALQADNNSVKIVLAGASNIAGRSYFAFARLKADGALDTTFGGTGKRVISYGTMASCYGVLVQPDRKIVAVGQTYNGTTTDFAVMRLNPAGGLDTTLDLDGRFSINLGSNDSAKTIVRDGQGRYVIGGSAQMPPAGGSFFAIARAGP